MAGYSDEQLILVARLYFVEGMPQGKVASIASVSQAKVSRMLSLARARGLVKITVAEAEPRDRRLEASLKQAFGIESIVIRNLSGTESGELRQLIGYFTAPAILDWFKSASTVAIAGGRTIQALVEHLKPPSNPRPLEFVQAMGTIDATPGPYDAVELGLALAGRWGGSFVRLNTPAILPDSDTCSRLLQLEQVQHVMTRLADADLALVGVGTLENSVFVDRDVLNPTDLETLKSARATGEILGRYFCDQGEECETPFKNRVVSLELSGLKNIARRVGVVVGSDRTAAIIAAIKGGLINALTIDQRGAQALMESATPARSEIEETHTNPKR